MSHNISYVQGQLLAAAQAVLIAHGQMVALGKQSKPLADIDALQDALIREMLRVADNTFGFRNDWGDAIQLAVLIVYMAEGYRHSICDAE